MILSYFSCLYTVSILSGLVSVCRQEEIRLDTARIHHQTDEQFLGVAIDSNEVKDHWTRLSTALKSARFQTLALGLSPSFLRFGGTSSDFLIFDDGSPGNNITKEYKVLNKGLYSPSVATADTPSLVQDVKQVLNYSWFEGDTYYSDEVKKDLRNFTMTGDMFDLLYQFVEFVGWNMTFDLNVLMRKQGSWDPANSIKLINYTAKKGYRLAGWELGNEPNSFYHLIKFRLTPEQLALDYIQLKKILKSYKQFENGIILGPSVTQLNKHSTDKFFKSFLTSGGADTVTAASFHQYYLSNKSATQEWYTDPGIFNMFIQEVATGVQLLRESGSQAQLWIGETSSAIGSLEEHASLTYRAGFMWLDKLGVAASGGVDVVIRQSFIGGINSIIDRRTLQPRPDYWLTLLYKLLIGKKVLQVVSPSNTGRLRAYAHCTATNRSGYRNGNIVIYVINLYDTDRNLTFPNFNTQEPVHVYHMEPDEDNLDSRTVLLNGRPLKMINDSTLPSLQPVKTTAPVSIKSKTYSFIVFPDISLKVCL